nr:MAG TPA: hypothetical protein [Caudoviricetes sp.]
MHSTTKIANTQRNYLFPLDKAILLVYSTEPVAKQISS